MNITPEINAIIQNAKSEVEMLNELYLYCETRKGDLAKAFHWDQIMKALAEWAENVNEDIEIDVSYSKVFCFNPADAVRHSWPGHIQVQSINREKEAVSLSKEYLESFLDHYIMNVHCQSCYFNSCPWYDGLRAVGDPSPDDCIRYAMEFLKPEE